jgi:hypothetical protein
MIPLILSLTVALGGSAADGAVVLDRNVGVSECPAQTPRGRRLATTYATSDLYASARERRGMRRAAPAEVRPLTDGDACKRLMALLESRATQAGGTLTGSRPEFYVVGEYYYAVLPAAPSQCTPRPNHVCIDTRWQGLDVFDRNFNLLVALLV